MEGSGAASSFSLDIFTSSCLGVVVRSAPAVFGSNVNVATEARFSELPASFDVAVG